MFGELQGIKVLEQHVIQLGGLSDGSACRSVLFITQSFRFTHTSLTCCKDDL